MSKFHKFHNFIKYFLLKSYLKLSIMPGSYCLFLFLLVVITTNTCSWFFPSECSKDTFNTSSISAQLLPHVHSSLLHPRRVILTRPGQGFFMLLLLLGGIEPNPGPTPGSSGHHVPSSTHPLRGALLNIRSAVNKASLLHDCIYTSQLDFICLTETWLRSSDPPAIQQDIAPQGFSALHYFRDGRKKSRGGGISMVFKDGLRVKKSKLNFKPKTFELLSVTIANKNELINVSTIYRPPPSPTAQFFEEFNSFCDHLESLPGKHIMVGDFNCPDQPKIIDPRLSTILSDRNCIQHVSDSTRERNLLDLVITFPSSTQSTHTSSNSTNLIQSLNTQPVPFSDHKLITFDVHFPRPYIATTTFSYRNIRSIASSPFLSILQNSLIYTNPPRGVDDYATQLDTDVLTALNTVAPLTTRTKRFSPRSSPVWMTKEAVNAKRTTRQLERRYKKSASVTDFSAWKRAGRASVKEIKAARVGYMLNMVKNSSNDPVKRWKVVKDLLHGSNNTNNVTDSNFTAETFSDYFVDKIALIHNSIMSSINSISQVLVPPPSPPSPLRSFSSVSVDEATQHIQSLSKSSPLDVIPVSVLKTFKPLFSVFLSELANRSFSEGKFPDLYKSSHITPLLKKTTLDTNDLASYRPISNLRTMGKLLERLAQTRLRSQILSSPAFSNHQSAYRPGHSTETACLAITDNLLTSAGTGKPCALVSLDLSAAFDCVRHSVLLDRLSHDFGFSGATLSWINSYLLNRTQFVSYANKISSPATMTSGVPQGSVLGPLLFSAYLSPVSRLIDSFKLAHHIYADDMTLTFSFDSVLSPLSLLNDCTISLSNWLMFNGLRLNPTKSEVMWSGTRAQLLSVPKNDILIASLPVPSSKSVKLIGVTFDPQLTFSQHITEICRTCNFHLLALRHIRPLIDTSTANMLATSIIHSRLDYCNSLFSGITDSNLNRLQRIQNRAAIIVTNSRGPVSCSSLLKQLHWLPIPNRIDFKIALLTYKVLTSQQPSYLNSLLSPYITSRSLRSSGQHFLSVPRKISATQSRAFRSYAPQLWNRLPQPLRDLAFSDPITLSNNSQSLQMNTLTYPNLSTFKTSLKTFLFDTPPKSLVP